MASLYYLLSSFPSLGFDREAPFGYDYFMSSCESILDIKSFKRLKDFNLYTPPTSLDGIGSLERDYWNWGISLRNDLVKLRADALGLKAEDYLRPAVGNVSTLEEAREAFSESNPLKVEEGLNKARWLLLESKRNGEIFNFDILLIYSMQLQILLRKASFIKEKGRALYEDEYNRTLKGAQTVLAENI